MTQVSTFRPLYSFEIWAEPGEHAFDNPPRPFFFFFLNPPRPVLSFCFLFSNLVCHGDKI